MSGENEARVRDILATVKPLAAEYYRLKLVRARTSGYDALRGKERIQIKGMAYGAVLNPGARMSRIKIDAPCDTVLLVLLNNATLEPREIWEAPFPSVVTSLARPGSKARERGALGVSAFQANCSPRMAEAAGSRGRG
jgi:hypothetical protein